MVYTCEQKVSRFSLRELMNMTLYVCLRAGHALRSPLVRSVPSIIAAYEVGVKPSRAFSLLAILDLALESCNVIVGTSLGAAWPSFFVSEDTRNRAEQRKAGAQQLGRRGKQLKSYKEKRFKPSETLQGNCLSWLR